MLMNVTFFFHNLQVSAGWSKIKESENAIVEFSD